MLEFKILGVFSLALLVCVGADLSILYALVFGLFLFFAYGLYQKHSPAAVVCMALSGIKTVRNILVTFVLIGMITAIWRAGGTIPFIVYHASRVCVPRAMVLVTFLLCCLISFLTGTAFGTAATMGVICVTMANSMGIPILYTGGAVLAGSYFGDRCSPMSTSALLVSTLTGTDIFHNIVNMGKTSLLPFAVTCAVYGALGLSGHPEAGSSAMRTVFADAFVLHPAVLIPAAVIILFSLFRVNVEITMSVSILCGAAVTILFQGTAPGELLKIAVFGFFPEQKALAALLSGGGILSMAKVFAIVCLSSCYAGIFSGTGFLDGVREVLCRISRRISPFGGILAASVLTGMISCNQTLAIMLTHQICGTVETDPERMAVHLENTTVVIAPLIPWSIAGAIPLAAVGAPSLCILTACYLYLLPLWNLLVDLRRERGGQRTRTAPDRAHG